MERLVLRPAKKKNDRIDAGKIADCLRCDFLPECYMVSTEIRDQRRTLRYRHLLVRQMVQLKNRISGLLLETGVSHNKQHASDRSSEPLAIAGCVELRRVQPTSLSARRFLSNATSTYKAY